MIANSKSVAADLAAALRPSAPVHVVYNAVDLDTFAPDGPVEDLDRRAGLAPAVEASYVSAWYRRSRAGRDTMCFCGPWPRFQPTCRSAATSSAVRCTTPLAVSTAWKSCRRSPIACGLAGRVGFTGFLPAAPAMRALDIVVHASTRPEPFGMVIAEAMACGRAVITSGSGGAAELIDAGVDALTHVPGDAEDLSRVHRSAGRRCRVATTARESRAGVGVPTFRFRAARSRSGGGV